ncbi:MAG TPA: DUF805 domain-containing protein [Caulobacteraceae bacterium]|nr:DUF805 domain-containing protein [Caulobacteraceae bacterium]
MNADWTQTLIVVRGSRWRGLRGAAGLAVAVAGLGGAMASVPGAAPLFPVWLALVAVSATFGAWIATSPARLELSPAGLAEQRLLGARRWAWSEVYDFRPALVGLEGRTVGFSFTTPPRTPLKRLGAAVTGLEGSLAPGWELDPPSLAGLLNGARDRWLAAGDPAPRPTPQHLLPGFVGARTGLMSYWLSAAGLMALTAGFAEFGWWLAAALLAPFWVRTYAGRLHDLGHSGWWQALAWSFGAALAGALVGRGAAPSLTADTVGAVWTIFTVAIGLAPGASEANRYGPAPGQLSPVALAEAFR